MKKLFFFVAIMVSAFVFAQKPLFTTAKINAATVYSNSAEISQTASVLLPKGSSEIVIKNVSSFLNENSIQIGAPANVTVLSVQFSTDYISEYDLDESNPAIKKVRDSILWIQKEIQKVGIQKISNTKTIELLDKNQQVSGVNSGLNMVDLMKMVDYYTIKRTEISNTLIALDEREKKIKTQLASLNDKLQINTKKEDKISKGKLIIQLMNEITGNTELEVSYLSYAASWVPFYELRANSINDPMLLMYKAKVTQNTGVDWKKVKLTLSSGNPNQNNQAPTVNPWFLRNQDTQMRVASVGAVSENSLNEIVVRGYGTSKDKNIGKEQLRSSISNYSSIVENQLNISFDIDIPYDILSNGKAHSVALKELKIPANFRYYAAPRIEKEAFY